MGNPIKKILDEVQTFRKSRTPKNVNTNEMVTNEWFCYSNEIRDNNFFVAATKDFAAATKRFVVRTKHFVVITNCFCYPYFNK